MAPKLKGFDHVHVYVADQARAEDWYAEVLSFRRGEQDGTPRKGCISSASPVSRTAGNPGPSWKV